MKPTQSPLVARTLLARFRALASAFSRPFQGSASGATLVEYLIVTGFIALVAIAGFNRFGRVVNKGLKNEAARIEGKGLPSTGDLLGELGNGTPPVCSIFGGPGALCVRGSGNCFVKGTPVATESGDRPIESIRVGERVWSRDMDTGRVELRPVTTTFVTRDRPIIDLELQVGVRSEHIGVTPGHRFWAEDRGWTPVEELLGTRLASFEGAILARQGALEGRPLASAGLTTTVYNLEVDGYHDYYVGHLHALVHNQNSGPNANNCPPPGGGTGGTAGTPTPGTIAAVQAAGVPQGGSYNQVRTKATNKGLGGEVNHMPAWNSWQLAGNSPFTQGTAPAIWMETADHRKMTSTGSSAAAKAYRAQQAALIQAGKIMEAVQMDIDEIHRRFGTKYDVGIQQMLDYLASQGIT